MDSKKDSADSQPLLAETDLAGLELQQVPADISESKTPLEQEFSSGEAPEGQVQAEKPPNNEQNEANNPSVSEHDGYQPVPAQQTTANVMVVTSQASVVQMQHEQHYSGQQKPDNHFILAILTMICCCFMFGLISLIYSLQVDSAYNRRDYEGARKASKTAKTWGIVALVIGIAGWMAASVSGLVQIIRVLVNT